VNQPTVDPDHSSEEVTPVGRALAAMGVPHREFIHPGQVHSLEQAAAERGQQPEQVVRSLLFRLPDEVFIMVLMAGPAQVSWPKLRRHLGVSRITTATQAEVLAVTGYPPGAVSPFGNPQPVRILVDDSVLAQGEISIGSGRRHSTVIMSTRDLLAALPAYEQGDFCGE
jgi:Cys-tRNA(Pro) deacylase